MSRFNIILTGTSFVILLFVVCSYSANAQSRSPKQTSCREFSNLQNGSLTANQNADAKFQVRKYLWTSWEINKKTCADLVMYTPNGNNFKWTYSITIDKERKKQLTVQFFDKGALQSTQTASDVRRWQNNPNYALELLDQNGKQIGIL